tara:strand:- start:151 stop:477 length:327 start_codon:yes stop_codon:yes gene_type:complete
MVCRLHESKKKLIFNESKNRTKGISTMTSEDIFKESFPQYTQVGGNHYTKFPIQPYEFISKNDLSFFQGNVVKYVCRYQRKGGIEDLKKIVHYCQLEMLKINDMKKKK